MSTAAAALAVLACCTLLVATGPATAEKVYRWVDDDGVVNFSSEPRPGAELVDLGPLPTIRFDTPVPGPDGPADVQPQRAPAAYRLAIGNLHDGEVVWNDARRLEVVFDIQPRLAAARGHRLAVYVDGERRRVLREGNRVVLENIDRGTHRIRGEIVDAGGRRLASSPELTVHHRQHSIATPEPAVLRQPVWMPILRHIELDRGAQQGGP